MKYTTIKCSLNRFCKNDYLKSKINDVILNVNKIIFEGYLLANLHVIRLLQEEKQIPRLNQKFFQNVLQLVSRLYRRKEKECLDQELVQTFEVCYQHLRPNSFQPGYRDYISAVLNNGVALEMETATKNHLVLNFYKRCSKYVQNIHPDLTKKDVYEVMKGIYEKNYSGNNQVVSQFRSLLGNQVPTEVGIALDATKVLQVYREILTYNKEKELRLFTLLPVKHSFTMSNILIDKTAIRDLILDDKGVNIGDEHRELYTAVRKLINEDPKSMIRLFFNIDRFETSKKKFIHFLTDGISVSVLLGEECITIPKRQSTKRKREYCDEPVVSSTNYDVTVGLDPGLRYVFVTKSNENIDDKKKSVKMSSRQYYHDTKFNWNKGKQQRSYKRHQEWLDYSSNMPSPKTSKLEELQSYAKYALDGLDMALQLHVTIPFRKWRFKTFIYKQKTFEKILKSITTKRARTENKQVIVGFGNWSNPRDSIIRGHRRGPVKEIKDKLQKWCEVVDVDEFRTSKLCCHCHCEMAKVKYNGKEVNSVLRCSNNECGITIDRDINGARNIYMLLTKMIQKAKRPEAFCRSKKICYLV